LKNFYFGQHFYFLKLASRSKTLVLLHFAEGAARGFINIGQRNVDFARHLIFAKLGGFFVIPEGLSEYGKYMGTEGLAVAKEANEAAILCNC